MQTRKKKGLPQPGKICKTIANILFNGEILVLNNLKIILKEEIKQSFTDSVHYLNQT